MHDVLKNTPATNNGREIRTRAAAGLDHRDDFRLPESLPSEYSSASSRP